MQDTLARRTATIVQHATRFLGFWGLKNRNRPPKLDSGVCVCDRVAHDARGAERRFAESEMPILFRPKVEKIVELLLYLAHARPNADKYQAVKFLYLADKEHLNRFGRPITFEVYYAFEYGPVASTTLDLLNGNLGAARAVGINGLPFDTEVVEGAKYTTTYIRSPHREVRRELFSKSDLKIFDEIISEYGDRTFDELYEVTHEHPAYIRAWEGKHPFSKRALMKYEDMIDDGEFKAELIEELEPLSSHM